jgi:hypothetical protein
MEIRKIEWIAGAGLEEDNYRAKYLSNTVSELYIIDECEIRVASDFLAFQFESIICVDFQVATKSKILSFTKTMLTISY